MKQVLGEKTRRRCEAIAGRPYRVAYANGTHLAHGEAECWFGEGPTVQDADLVNYRRGTWTPYIRDGQYVERSDAWDARRGT